MEGLLQAGSSYFYYKVEAMHFWVFMLRQLNLVLFF
ncbi:hypothetical protein V6Z12_D05G312100 [Gossypium hirsutum]